MDADEVLDFYNSGIEKGRLHANIGLIEFARTKEILMDLLPPSPAASADAILLMGPLYHIADAPLPFRSYRGTR